MTDDGYARSYRRKWRNPIFRNLRDAGIWSWMTDTAAWKPTKVRFGEFVIVLERGQLITSERFMAEGFCVDRAVIRRLLDTLEGEQMIARHKTHGGTLITICNYDKYQHGDEGENPPESPGETQGEPTENPNKKKVKKVRKEESVDESSARGTRLDPDWRPDERDLAFAFDAGLTADEIDRAIAEFRDYWCAVPGQRGRKLDWPATWRNRVRQIAGRPRPNGAQRGGQSGRGFVAALGKVVAGADLRDAE